MTDQNQPEPLQSSLLAELEGQGIRHGFFTRAGGVSEGIYAGLNTGAGSSDDHANLPSRRNPDRSLVRRGCVRPGRR